MAKTSGLGDAYYVGGYDLSGDISSVDQISGAHDTLDVTPINSYGSQRLYGLRTGDWQFTSFFDAAAGQAHPDLSALPTTDVICTYARGTTLGSAGACISGRQLNYDGTRDNTGNLTLKVEVQGDGYGMEWGAQLTPGLRTDTTATAGTAYDQGAGGTHGAQAYLQITSFTGTSVDVTITHCTTSGGSYSGLIDFSSQTGIGGWRQVATGTVDEFLKVNTSGTFTSATFSVVFVLNQVAVKF